MSQQIFRPIKDGHQHRLPLTRVQLEPGKTYPAISFRTCWSVRITTSLTITRISQLLLMKTNILLWKETLRINLNQTLNFSYFLQDVQTFNCCIAQGSNKILLCIKFTVSKDFAVTIVKLLYKLLFIFVIYIYVPKTVFFKGGENIWSDMGL